MLLTVSPSDIRNTKWQGAPADKPRVNELLALLNLAPSAASDLPEPPELHLQAVSTRSGPELLPGLADAIDRASGWVMHRQMVSASMLQMHVETQLRCLLDLYASLVEQGLELSRDSHMLLTERCSCARLQQYALGGIITLHLDITLPAEPLLIGQWWQLRTA